MSSLEDGYERKTIIVAAGSAGNAPVRKARAEGWEQESSTKEPDGRFRIELRRPQNYTQPPPLPVNKGHMAFGLVAFAALAALVIWGGIQLFSKDDTAAPAVMTNTQLDAGRCEQMAKAYEKYRVEKLVPIVNAGPSAGTGSFRAITADTEDVLKTFGKWTNGLNDSGLNAKFTTAISTGRTFVSVAQGSDSADTIASSAAAFIDDTQTAFAACPKS